MRRSVKILQTTPQVHELRTFVVLFSALSATPMLVAETPPRVVRVLFIGNS